MHEAIYSVTVVLHHHIGSQYLLGLHDVILLLHRIYSTPNCWCYHDCAAYGLPNCSLFNEMYEISGQH